MVNCTVVHYKNTSWQRPGIHPWKKIFNIGDKGVPIIRALSDFSMNNAVGAQGREDCVAAKC